MIRTPTSSSAGTTAARLYVPSTPVVLQRDTWSCLPKSVGWALRASGLIVPDNEFDRAMVDNGIITVGGQLADKSGADLAGFLPEVVPGASVVGGYIENVAFSQVAREAGHYAVVIGCTRFHHYVAVSGYDTRRNVLLLRNSAPGWLDVYETMSAKQFNRIRPVNMIRIARPSTVAQVATNTLGRLVDVAQYGHHGNRAYYR